MKAGSIARRCHCRDQCGRTLGKSCPQLKRKNHGTRSIQQALPPAADGARRRFRRSGYASVEAAQSDLDHVRTLLALPEDDRDTEQIAALLHMLSTQSDPLPAVDDMQRALRAGVPLGQRLTVGEWLNEWLRSKRTRKSTWSRYESDIRNHLTPRLGDVRLDRLRVSHVMTMFSEIEERNREIEVDNANRREVEAQRKRATRRAEQKRCVAELRAMPPFRRVTGAATQQRIRATLRAALNDAIAQQLLTFNPAAHVKLPSGKRPKALVWTHERVRQWHQHDTRPSPVMVWTPEQAGAFLDHVSGERLYGLYHLIAFRGLRRGEACGLRWVDVDFDAATLTVATQLTQDGWNVVEAEPKTDAGARVVAMDSATIAALRAHRARQAQERLEWGPAWVDSGRVFTRENGEQLHPGMLSDAFERAVRDSGLPPVRLHDLRHGAATLMLAGGAEMKTVQDMLGHSSMAITADTYTSVLPHVARDAAEAAAALVPRAAR